MRGRGWLVNSGVGLLPFGGCGERRESVTERENPGERWGKRERERERE